MQAKQIPMASQLLESGMEASSNGPLLQSKGLQGLVFLVGLPIFAAVLCPPTAGAACRPGMSAASSDSVQVFRISLPISLRLLLMAISVA